MEEILKLLYRHPIPHNYREQYQHHRIQLQPKYIYLSLGFTDKNRAKIAGPIDERPLNGVSLFTRLDFEFKAERNLCESLTSTLTTSGPPESPSQASFPPFPTPQMD